MSSIKKKSKVDKKEAKKNDDGSFSTQNVKVALGITWMILGLVTLLVALGVARWPGQGSHVNSAVAADNAAVNDDVASKKQDLPDLDNIDVQSSEGVNVPVQAAKEKVDEEAGKNQTWWQSKWWEKVAYKAESDRFETKKILIVNTSNFNATVTGPLKEKPLLVAFYDARSQSFKELQKHLEQTAEKLNKLSDTPGSLAACDVTIHSYLGKQFAPQMRTAWQDKENLTSFKFGRPNYYPMIITTFLNGSAVEEYTGVVNSQQIIRYMMRISQEKLAVLSDAEAVSKFFFTSRVGPLILGCGLTNGTENTSQEFEAFNMTAYYFHGKAIFAMASLNDCRKGLQARSSQYKDILDEMSTNETAQVIFARKGGNGMHMLKNHSQLKDNTTRGLRKWAAKSIPETLEEMTPDNSHVYLGRPTPLAVFLLNSKDPAAQGRAEELTLGLQPNTSDTLRFVWSSCKLYGGQFEAEKHCQKWPVLVIVDTRSMDWQKNQGDRHRSPQR